MRIQLQTLEDLSMAATLKHSVYQDRGPKAGQPVPASVVMNYQARIVKNKLRNGLYIYREREDGLSVCRPMPF